MRFISDSGWRDVAIAAAARAISSGGDYLADTALVLQFQQQGRGGIAVAMLLVAAALPAVLLARWTGRLTDHVDSRLLLAATGLAQAGICLALAYATGLAEVITLVSLLASGLAVTQSCLSALIPSMVTPGDLPRATAVAQSAASAGVLLAPALGGLLMGHFGLRVPLLADAASYLAIAAAGWLIRTRRGAVAGQAGTTGQAGTAGHAGWRLRQDPLLWPALVLLGTVVAAASLVNVAEVFLIRGALHATAAFFGLVSSVWVGAAMTGSWLLARRRPGDAGLGRALLAALALTCLSIAAMAAIPAAAWLIPASIAGGLGNGGINHAATVLVGRRAPAAARGHAFAVFGAVANAATTLGCLLGGVLLDVLPVRAAIALAGLAGLAAATALAPALLRAAARDGIRHDSQPARPGAMAR